jgi:hypothetical protein
MTIEVSETFAESPATVYALLSDVKRMAKLSPECFAIWVTRRTPDGAISRFVGWNRRAAYVWFTTCRVTIADPDREYAFDVTTFGQPVARWGYRVSPSPEGTIVTEYWQDQRNKAAFILGRIFTGKAAADRPAVNREAMQKTLTLLKSHLSGTR